jgi:hypothetical protein
MECWSITTRIGTFFKSAAFPSLFRSSQEFISSPSTGEDKGGGD